MGGNKNCRSKKTEEMILTVFFNHPEYTMCQIAKKAGVARSTVYNHHHSVRQIIPDCESYILAEYEQTLKKNAEIKIFYFNVLIFIIKNRQFFEIFLKFNDRKILIEMLSCLKPRFDVPERNFQIYVAEVVEIIFEWGKSGFSESEIDKIVSDIVYLTLTIHKRLGALK